MFKTMLIEDNPIYRDLYRNSLKVQFLSMEILEAEDGAEAMKKIAAFHPDLIFMDIRLSGDNGLELTKRIKADYPDIIIAVLTNYDFQEYREAAAQNGADYFLVKSSVTSEEIFAFVKKILSEKGFNANGSSPAKATA
jgi:DNA-binding NarL/FixJ family response regulator